jgi:hypothetical protein
LPLCNLPSTPLHGIPPKYAKIGLIILCTECGRAGVEAWA